jgi:endonuclease VIII
MDRRYLRPTIRSVPEGDTLRILADKIDERLAGQRVVRSVFRDPRLAGRELAGTSLVGADAYGKHLFVRFDDGRTLHAHLRMDGTFKVNRPSSAPEWKRRVELRLESGSIVGEAVPVLELLPTADEHSLIDHLGPDLCARSGPPDPAQVADRMVANAGRPVTGALLDQRNVAGFGNVYGNDVPFIVGVNPLQPVGAIDGLESLVRIGTALIRVNARLRVQNTTGRRLATDARWMHGVGRRPCPICGDRLHYRSERESPWERSITWCETCQPLVEQASVDLLRVRHLIGLHPAVREPAFPAMS